MAQQLAGFPEPCARHDRRCHQEAEARRGLAGQATEEPGRNADAGTADARDEGEHLGQADAERAAEGDRVHLASLGAPAIGQPQDRTPDTQHHGHEAGVANGVLDWTGEKRPHGDGRNSSDDEEPGHLAVRVALERPIPDGGQPGRNDLQPVTPEVDEEGQQRAHMQDDTEFQRSEEGLLDGPPEQPRHEDEVTRAGDRDELREPLGQTHHQCLDDREVHATRPPSIGPRDAPTGALAWT